jgi:type II secretory pathway pseudopilin PulG
MAGHAHAKPTGSRRSAFTLVELLVVIAMVALGTLLLVPALARTGNNSPTIQCLNNLSQLQRAFTMYAADYNGQLAGQNSYYGSTSLTNWCLGWLDWDHSLANTNIVYLLDAALGSYTGRRVSVYKCPADRLPSLSGPRVRSYSMNGFVGGTVERDSFGITGYRIYLKDTDFTVPGPAKTLVFIDEHPDSINNGCFEQSVPTSAYWTDLPASYHVGAGCLSFEDGHVEAHKWVDVNTRLPVQKTMFGGAASPNDKGWLAPHATAPL